MRLVPLHFQIPSDLFWCSAAMVVGALFPTGSQSRHGKSNQITYVWALSFLSSECSCVFSLSFHEKTEFMNSFSKTIFSVGKMAVKVWLYKQEDPNSDLQHWSKMPGMVAGTCHPSFRRQGQKDLAESVTFRLGERPPSPSQ